MTTTPNPVVTLKSLRIAASLSEETTAFTAAVFVDGKRAGHAKNDGHGGMTLVTFDDRAVRDRVREYGETLIPDEYKKLSNGDEWIVDQLVEQHLKDKDAARLAKIDKTQKAYWAGQGKSPVRVEMANGKTVWFGADPGSEEAGAGMIAATHKTTVTIWAVLR